MYKLTVGVLDGFENIITGVFMSAVIIDGFKIASDVRHLVAEKQQHLLNLEYIHVLVVLVGENPASVLCNRQKKALAGGMKDRQLGCRSTAETG